MRATRLVLLACALGCGTAPPAAHVAVASGSATGEPPPASPADPRAPGAGRGRASAASPPRSVRPRGRIEAPHGGAIALLAVTAGGTAAMSCDELGGVRLWPTLDGSAEPRVVDLPHPRALALGADPRGFLVTMIDDVGGLVIQVIDRDGLTLQRASLAAEPAFMGLAMSARGPIAWRADQRLVRLRADGTVAAQLAAEAGQRVLDVAVAGDRAIAVIESGTPVTTRARWITLGDTLAWGSWLPGASTIGAKIAVSPTGNRLASLASTGTGASQLTVIDTSTGTLVAQPTIPGTLAIGVADDHHAVVATATGIAWIDLTAPAPTPQPTRAAATDVVEQGILGIGGGRAIGASNGELMIATPTKVEFLGYDLGSPAVVAGAAKGQLLIGVGDTFALLDRELRATSSPQLHVSAHAAVSSLRWLAEDDWLVEVSKVEDGTTTLSLVDVARDHSTLVRTGMPLVQTLMFEPSTDLVTLSLGETPDVSRYDRGHHRLDKLATLAKPKGYEQAELAPVVPALAGGVQVVVAQMRDRMTLRWIKDPRFLDKGAAITVDGSLAAVDRAGHAFVWQNAPTGPLELVVYADGKRTGTFPSDGPTVLSPDPTGTRILLIGQNAVTLVSFDGSVGVVLWAQAIQGVTEALWLDDGAIAIVTSAGLARLDAATGHVVAARCGWRFGLSATQHPLSPRVEPVCAQLRDP